MSRHHILPLGVVSALLFLGAPPALAHGACQVVKTVQVIGGFTPSPLDVWAFPVVMSPMPSTRIIREVVVCPSVIVVTPVVSPFVFGTPSVIGAPSAFLDPPAPVLPTRSDPAAAPVRASGPIITGVVPHDTVRDLAVNPGQHDRQIVRVTGTIVASQARFDVHGNPYTELRLEADGSAITVIIWGQAGVRTGLQARVVGPFYDLSPFIGEGGSSLRDVLEAQLIEAAP